MKGKRPLFVIDDRAVTRPDFEKLVDWSASLLRRHTRVAVRVTDPLLLNTVLVACRDGRLDLIVCPALLSDRGLKEVVSLHRVDLVLTQRAGDRFEIREMKSRARREIDPGLSIFTSGTTGPAKLAKHTWKSIQGPAQFVGPALYGATWLMTYTPTGYAGLQVFFSAFNNDGALCYSLRGFDATCRLASAWGVNAISATPTYWRLLISSWPAEAPKPRLLQASLGGEVVRQDVIDAIRESFRPARITHIYASTEAGTAIVVSDGKAGFPVSLLHKKGPVRLRVRNGFLETRSPFAMAGYRGAWKARAGWFRTGDAVEKRGGRYFFCGRADEKLNVGGVKVFPEEVEAAINALPGVADSAVYGKNSSIVGTLLVADIVMSRGARFDPSRIKESLRSVFPPQKIPQILRRVNSIMVANSGKKVRASA